MKKLYFMLFLVLAVVTAPFVVKAKPFNSPEIMDYNSISFHCGYREKTMNTDVCITCAYTIPTARNIYCDENPEKCIKIGFTIEYSKSSNTFIERIGIEDKNNIESHFTHGVSGIDIISNLEEEDFLSDDKSMLYCPVNIFVAKDASRNDTVYLYIDSIKKQNTDHCSDGIPCRSELKGELFQYDYETDDDDPIDPMPVDPTKPTEPSIEIPKDTQEELKKRVICNYDMYIKQSDPDGPIGTITIDKNPASSSGYYKTIKYSRRIVSGVTGEDSQCGDRNSETISNISEYLEKLEKNDNKCLTDYEFVCKNGKWIFMKSPVKTGTTEIDDNVQTTDFDYENPCRYEDVLKTMRIIGKLVVVLKILVPLIIIVLGMMDYFKAITSDDEKAIGKATQALIRRIIAGLLVFLAPSVINAGLKLVGIVPNSKNIDEVSGIGRCVTCILKVSDCGKGEKLPNSKLSDPEELKKIGQDGSGESKPKTSEPINSSEFLKIDNSSFLKTAETVWKKIINNGKFVYTGYNDTIPLTDSCNCSSYVSWVLYEYTKDDFWKKDGQRDTKFFYNNNLSNYWEQKSYSGETDLTEIVKPGDIVVRRDDNGGHMNIVAKKVGDKIYAYDCGSTNVVQNKNNIDGADATDFYKKDVDGNYRPAKIIRIKSIGDNNDSSTNSNLVTATSNTGVLSPIVNGIKKQSKQAISDNECVNSTCQCPAIGKLSGFDFTLKAGSYEFSSVTRKDSFVYVKIPCLNTSVRVNSKFEKNFENAFLKLCELKNSGKISGIINTDTVVDRLNSRKTSCSLHAYGAAVDINYDYTINVNGKTYTPYSPNFETRKPYDDFIKALGSESDSRNEIYTIWKEAFEPNGFKWGGNWSDVSDPSHFELY